VSAAPWLLPFLLFAAFAVLLVGIGAAVIGGLLWIDRSKSPRAGRLRHLLGGQEKQRPTGEKRWFWPGEDRALCREASKAFAARRGLRYEESDARFVPLLQPFREMRNRSGERVEDVVRWESFALFSCTTEDSESSTTRTLLYVDGSELRLPPFLITGETIVHRTLFAGHDIDFADDPEFSSRYHLESSEEAAVRRLFTSGVRAAFVAVGECRLECVASKLLFSETQKTTVAAFEIFVDESTRLIRALSERSRW